MYLYNSGQIIREPVNKKFKIWISGQVFAHNLKNLNDNNIRSVCSIGSQHFKFPQHINHLYLQIEDRADQDITPCLQIAYKFIQKQRQISNVLIHCIAGVSRSATIVIYYLMKKYGLSLIQSLKMVQQSRSIIRPNIGFYKQLLKQQIQLKKTKIDAKL